jgi:hypothetical protein
MQQPFIEQLTAAAQAHPAIRAAWLTGSLGRGAGDRYADVDAALLLSDKATFASQAEAWLNQLHPLVLYRLMFGGAMINAMSDEGLRIDIWLHEGTEVTLPTGKALPLVDKDGALRWQALPATSTPAATAAQQIETQLQEFWRMIALTPTVIGRQEYIVSIQGLGFEIGVLSDLLIAHAGRQRERGIKNLNDYLRPEDRAAVEQALDFGGLTPVSLIQTHLKLAAIVQQIGPALAQRSGFPYPYALEATVVNYLQRELAYLGLADTLHVLHRRSPGMNGS